MNTQEEIEARKTIKIVQDKFLSEEWVAREKLPCFKYNLGNSNYIKLVNYQGQYYVARRTTTASPGPIPVLHSGKR